MINWQHPYDWLAHFIACMFIVYLSNTWLRLRIFTSAIIAFLISVVGCELLWDAILFDRSFAWDDIISNILGVLIMVIIIKEEKC